MSKNKINLVYNRISLVADSGLDEKAFCKKYCKAFKGSILEVYKVYKYLDEKQAKEMTPKIKINDFKPEIISNTKHPKGSDKKSTKNKSK